MKTIIVAQILFMSLLTPVYNPAYAAEALSPKHQIPTDVSSEIKIVPMEKHLQIIKKPILKIELFPRDFRKHPAKLPERRSTPDNWSVLVNNAG